MEKPSKWLGYVSKIDPNERQTYFVVGSVSDRIITEYNMTWVWNVDSISDYIYEEIDDHFVTPEEYEKMRDEVSFVIDNYMSTDPVRHENPQEYLINNLWDHQVHWYADAKGVDYKTVWSFAKIDDAPMFGNATNTYKKYKYGAMVYSLLQHLNGVKLEKYTYIEISKKNTYIPEKTTYTKEVLYDYIGRDRLTEEDMKLQKKDLIVKFRPRKDPVNIIEFEVNDKFIEDAKRFVLDNISLMQGTLATLQIYIDKLWH